MDPENGDFRLRPGSPATGYGCQTFGSIDKSNGRGGPTQIERHAALALAGDRIDVSGPITVDTSWLADTVCVVGDLEIVDAVTLSVAAGVRVEFQGHYRLDVRGRLLALGTAAQPVLLTSSDPEAFKIDASLDGAWNGIRFERTLAANEPSRLEYCVIEYAKSVRDSILVGPLVLDNYSGLQVVNSVIRHNVADRGAALFCFHSACPQLTGCLIYDNHAFIGGAAVYALDSYPRLVNCTIVHNHDLNPEPPTEATAVISYMSKPQVTGCILWENSTNYFLPAQLWEVKPFYTTWSDIDGGWLGEGNFDLDPEFLGGGVHAYSIKTSSPCLNAGDPDTTGLLLPGYDLAGCVRIENEWIDVGAYEGNPVTNVPDALNVVRLWPNLPNPFNPHTVIAFALDRPRELVVEIYDVRGRRITELASGYFEEGKHQVTWDGLNKAGNAVASGVYLVQLRAETILDSRKMMLVR